MFKIEVSGGGFIEINDDEKILSIHGKSNSFGAADHRVAAYMLSEHFKNDPIKKDYTFKLEGNFEENWFTNTWTLFVNSRFLYFWYL